MKSTKDQYIERISKAIEEQTGHKNVTVSTTATMCYFESDDPDSVVHSMSDRSVLADRVTELSIDDWVLEFKSNLE